MFVTQTREASVNSTVT